MTTVTERLRAIRQVYGNRGDARTGADIGYLVYAALLVLVIVAFPVVRALVVWLAQPAVVSVLDAPATRPVVSATGGLLLVAAAWTGRVRGPVHLSPFFVTVLARTDMPRSRTLLRPFAATTLVVAAATGAIGALVGGVLVSTGGASPAGGVGFVLACAAFGVVGCVVWLAGQRRSRRSWTLPAVLLAMASLTVMSEPLTDLTPWGWVAMAWPTTGATAFAPVILLGATAAATALAVPRLLNSLDATSLVRQGERWQSAASAAFTGDFATALGGFRARPTIGRDWPAVATRNLIARFVVRDLLGALRTPGRFLTASVVLTLSCALCAVAFIAGPWPTWLPAAAGSAACFLAVGVFSDGFRHTAETAWAPPLYGYTTTRLYLLHATVPVVVCLAATAGGAAIAVTLGAPAAAAGTVGLVAVLQVVVRAYDSAKGLVPIVLLTTSVPSPAGDPTILMMLAWQADALLVGTIAGAVIITQAAAGTSLDVIVTAAVVAGAMTALLKRRLRATP